jgi:hypothetical protein
MATKKASMTRRPATVAPQTTAGVAGGSQFRQELFGKELFGKALRPSLGAVAVRMIVTAVDAARGVCDAARAGPQPWHPPFPSPSLFFQSNPGAVFAA